MNNSAPSGRMSRIVLLFKNLRIHTNRKTKMKLAYWIHGKMGSGKTQLARRICGPDAVVIHRGTTAAATTRMMKGAKAVIFEEYREELARDTGLIAEAVSGCTIAKGVPGGKEVKKVKLDVEVMVVVSEFPPEDEAIRSRFYVVKMKAPSRQNDKGLATQPAPQMPKKHK